LEALSYGLTHKGRQVQDSLAAQTQYFQDGYKMFIVTTKKQSGAMMYGAMVRHLQSEVAIVFSQLPIDTKIHLYTPLSSHTVLRGRNGAGMAVFNIRAQLRHLRILYASDSQQN
jgi:hypothetical protein